MSTRPRTAKRFATLASLSALALVAVPSTAGAASEGEVEVVNTETIQVYTDPTGKVQTKRVYEQISLTGKGAVELTNPIETDGLRNLDEFGGFEVKEGQQVFETTVDGDRRLRSVSDFGGKLPLEVDVDYFLDGKSVEPGDVVGADGLLQVAYTVRNVTAVPQEVSFDDGSGGTVTKTVDVPIPMVGSLTTTAPSNFTDVESKTANIAGDGKGGTKLSFTMTLFPPLGSDTAEFGYTARISDGVVPRADISALPVNPLKSATFKTAATSYQGGADTGARLAAGATTIDENLLKLRDGAGDLLAGLIKLREGSEKLSDGLSGEAAPGSVRLSDGMGQLDDGIGELDEGANKLDDGLGKISDGSAELAGGADKAAAGGRKLRDGAGRLDGGLGKLSGGALELDNGAGKILAGQKALRDGLRLLESGAESLPATVRDQLASNAQYLGLLGGMQRVVDGIGNPGDVFPAQPTMLGALNAVKGGLAGPVTAGLTTIRGGIPASQAELRCAAAVLTQLAGGAAAPVACGASGVPAIANPVGPILGAQVLTLNTVASGLSQGADDLDDLEDGLGDIQNAIDTQFLVGLTRVIGGLYNPGANPDCAVGASTPADPTDDCGIKQAVAFFKGSIPVLVDGITANISATLLDGISVPAAGCDPSDMTLLCGGNALVAGSGDLKAGTEKLLKGSGELGAGGSLLYDKLGELSDGLDQISDGAGRLSDGAAEAKAGTGRLVDGTAQLRAGSGQLADGAEELAAGLSTAAAGSGKITAGMGKASKGAPKLVDGAQRLSDEGTKKLVKAGEDTTQEYGEMYATIAAGAERADAEGMAYGAPEGAFGLTAYSYVIKGENGEGSRNLTRGLAGLVMLGLGGGALALRRRFI